MRFELVSGDNNGKLPVRSTKGSAGYDFFVSEPTTCPAHAITLIPTGVKAQIDDGYYLQLAVRSSTPKKKGLILANGIGIVDADYYNNPDNEGEIFFQIINLSPIPVYLKKGDRIGQGIIMRYDRTDDDSVETIRTGGMGSTGA